MPHLKSCAAVGHDAAGSQVHAAAEDLDTLRLFSQVLDVGALGKEAAVKHEEQVDGLMHAGCAKRVARAPECCKLSILLLASVNVQCKKWCSCSCVAA